MDIAGHVQGVGVGGSIVNATATAAATAAAIVVELAIGAIGAGGCMFGSATAPIMSTDVILTRSIIVANSGIPARLAVWPFEVQALRAVHHT